MTTQLEQDCTLGRLVYTPREVAAALGISVRSAYQLIKSGELPTVQVGARRRIPRAALEQFANTHIQGSANA